MASSIRAAIKDAQQRSAKLRIICGGDHSPLGTRCVVSGHHVHSLDNEFRESLPVQFFLHAGMHLTAARILPRGGQNNCVSAERNASGDAGHGDELHRGAWQRAVIVRRVVFHKSLASCAGGTAADLPGIL